jgi:hypothetical protein
VVVVVVVMVVVVVAPEYFSVVEFVVEFVLVVVATEPFSVLHLMVVVVVLVRSAGCGTPALRCFGGGKQGKPDALRCEWVRMWDAPPVGDTHAHTAADAVRRTAPSAVGAAVAVVRRQLDFDSGRPNCV